MLAILFVLNLFVAGFVTVEVEFWCNHGIISGHSCVHSHDLFCAHTQGEREKYRIGVSTMAVIFRHTLISS